MSDIFGQSLELSSLGRDSTHTSSWRRHLQKAMRESDPEKLLGLVHTTELALYYRWLELGTEGQPEERQAMRGAVDDLWSLKVHKLGWPDDALENEK